MARSERELLDKAHGGRKRDHNADWLHADRGAAIFGLNRSGMETNVRRSEPAIAAVSMRGEGKVLPAKFSSSFDRASIFITRRANGKVI